MQKNLIAHASVTINAGNAKVWDALTKPEAIKAYFFGTNVVKESGGIDHLPDDIADLAKN